MTISTTTSTNSYTANGTITQYDFTFIAYADSQVTVELDGVAVDTFSVLRNDNNVGGRVTLNTAPANGVAIVIRRVIPLTQTLDLVRFGRFPAENVERALDEGVMIDQQIIEDLRRLDEDVTSRNDAFVASITALIQQTFAQANAQSVVPIEFPRVIGDGTTTQFAITNTNSSPATSYLVHLDGVRQKPLLDYTVSASQITFVTAPAVSVSIDITYFEPQL